MECCRPGWTICRFTRCRLPDPIARYVASARQQQVLDLVREHVAMWGRGPTYDEIGHRMGITKQAVTKHVDALLRKRLVTHEPASHATLMTVDR